MTSRGGGQPRRSHTKSRLGCATCKRRHIRCDENEPQCNNCTKHNVRCDYQDSRAQKPEPGVGNGLTISPEIQKELDNWKQTGQLPLVNLGGVNLPPPTNYNNADLRLIYHIATIANRIVLLPQKRNSPWPRRVPKFVELAASYPFVMSALLGMSAAHLSWVSENQEALQLSYEHHGVALNGLQAAVGQFSKQNADAIVAASILLSWQATDWQSWALLMQGTSTVLNAMRQWKDESSFGDLIDEKDLYLPSSSQLTRSPENDRQLLLRILRELATLESFMDGCLPEEAKGLQDLTALVETIHDSLPITTAEKQFQLFHPFRVWMFCLPMPLLKKARSDPKLLVLIAYYYAIALELEPLFPDIGAHFFGTMALGPIEDIQQCLKLYGDNITQEHAETLNQAMSLMKFALRSAKSFKLRMGWTRDPSAAYGIANVPGISVNVNSTLPISNPHEIALLYNFDADQPFPSTHAGSGVDASVLSMLGFGGGPDVQPISYYTTPDSSSLPTTSGPPM